MRTLIASLALLAGSCASVQTPPAGTDADTVAWWSLTGSLSGDDMEGRDTGSAGYDRAARLVQGWFEKAGLKPAGENGGWRQTIPLQEVRVEKDGTSFEILTNEHGFEEGGRYLSRGAITQLAFLHQITVRPSVSLPATISAPLAFRGYCSSAEMLNVENKVVVCFGARRAGMTTAGQRLDAAAKARAVGIINVDDPGFTIEPSRWPEAYARSISFRDAAPPAYPSMVVMRLSADALSAIVSDEQAVDILKAGAASQPLPSFDVPAVINASFQLSWRELKSDNVLALLPGADPKLKDEIVLVSAHLDGYGYGEPVNGDALYNGAFDDAAYVATLVRLAESQAGKGFRRSVLFAVYTGEEKGLLGSNWYSTHLTVPKEKLAAVINLDQLRPLFPLKIVTMHAIADTTLAMNVKRVAAGMGIEIRPDLEPERNLNQRTDHFPFLRMGVPATNFVFGFDPGTEAERRYREWYQVRYHRPQDDMGQPLDWGAARDMNAFFYRLVADVANDDVRPSFLPGSQWAPK
jgi:hypothetical protein